jgi:hypothetical protein
MIGSRRRWVDRIGRRGGVDDFVEELELALPALGIMCRGSFFRF